MADHQENRERDSFSFRQQDSDPFDTPYPDAAYQKDASRPAAPPRSRPVKRQKHPRLYRLIVLAESIILIVIAGYLILFSAQYPAFRAKDAALRSSSFLQGITVDGLSIGGMTYEQALRVLEGSTEQEAPGLRIQIHLDDMIYLITDDDIPYARNLENVLDRAYAVGRRVTGNAAHTDETLFERRYLSLRQTAEQGLALSTSPGYRHQDVVVFVDKVASLIDRDPVDSELISVDFVKREFFFSDDESGRKLDKSALILAIETALDARRFDADLYATASTIPAAVTKVNLMNRFGSLTVRHLTVSSPAGDAYVRQMVEALNGVEIQSGNAFSLLDTLKARSCPLNTEDRIPSQLASLLFDTALSSGMTLISRQAFSAIDSTVPPGLDARLDENTDLRFRNDLNAPVCFLCYYTPRGSAGKTGDVTMELFGITKAPGESIELNAVQTSSLAAPAEDEYVENPLLPAGTRLITREASDGSIYTTYRVYLQNGREYRREIVCTSTYPALPRHIEYNH